MSARYRLTYSPDLIHMQSAAHRPPHRPNITELAPADTNRPWVIQGQYDHRGQSTAPLIPLILAHHGANHDLAKPLCGARYSIQKFPDNISPPVLLLSSRPMKLSGPTFIIIINESCCWQSSESQPPSPLSTHLLSSE